MSVHWKQHQKRLWSFKKLCASDLEVNWLLLCTFPGLRLHSSARWLRRRSLQLWFPALNHTALLYGLLIFLWVLNVRLWQLQLDNKFMCMTVLLQDSHRDLFLWWWCYISQLLGEPKSKTLAKRFRITLSPDLKHYCLLWLSSKIPTL